VAFTVVGGLVSAIAAVADPARLASMELPEPPETVGAAG
jgi:RNA polymerase sigma-70 factor (ECF subfamily)